MQRMPKAGPPAPTSKATAAPPGGRLRIGFFTDTYAPQVNGISISLQLLVRGLRAAGHEVTIFAPRFPGYKDPEPGIYRVPSVRYMHKPPMYVAVPGTPRTTLSLRRCKFDVLHVHSPLTVGLLAYLTATTKNVPLIYTYHTSITDYTHYVRLVGRTRPFRWVARWFSTATTNLGDQIVVPSIKFKKLLHDQKVRRPIHLIPNGIDLSRFKKPRSRGTFRRRLGMPARAPLLLYVGRIAPEKRLDFLMEAFSRIGAVHPNAHLVFAGDGSSRSKLEAQAAKSAFRERIHFLGMVSHAELPDLLHDATLFLSASTSEVHPISMIEAITAGLPIVAVKDDAFEGMLVDNFNGRATTRSAGALATAVSELLQDTKSMRQYRKNSLKLSRNYSIKAQVDSLVKLYRDAIHENRGQ